MNSAKVIMILALFSTIKATIGRPVNCLCRNNAVACYTRGCSVGTNYICDNTNFGADPFVYYGDLLYFFEVFTGFVGCNCPDYPNRATYNGIYAVSTGNHVRYNSIPINNLFHHI
ncbi:unnamed protein product [Didymodactylos carnosus]|uniref:Uncharacterized protein n=1 Tax=Didymodactylos carnosus TaxID=1234261 RepID=A0A815F529_9BILA|nr:unnamed protein product [Didymodactylos carnosus]CAF4167723.1 unnamed protein product [Didymodactylos carnosus]